ncbi:MAG: hypothetical protein M5U17_12220 [Ignavibacterium sp.]|nr:hypothetical protein [Ignavibacterium sp.]
MKLFFQTKTNISFIVSALILILINYLFTGIALLNTFGYEFAAVNGLLFVIIAGLFTLNKIQKAEYDLIKILKYLLVFYFLPLIITLINSLLTMFCSFWDGMLFYLLILLAFFIAGIFFGAANRFLFQKVKTISLYFYNIIARTDSGNRNIFLSADLFLFPFNWFLPW